MMNVVNLVIDLLVRQELKNSIDMSCLHLLHSLVPLLRPLLSDDTDSLQETCRRYDDTDNLQDIRRHPVLRRARLCIWNTL